MAFIPVPDVIQVEVRAVLVSRPVENTFYYLVPGVIDQELLDAVAETARDYVEENAAIFSTAWLFNGVYARDLSDSTFLSALAPATDVINGTQSGPLPNNASFAIKRTSGFSGRSARGRIFWMGMCDSYLSSTNTVASVSANSMVSWLEGLDAAIASEGVTPVIVSRFNAGVPRTTGVTYVITDWSYTDLQVDTQRGRLT